MIKLARREGFDPFSALRTRRGLSDDQSTPPILSASQKARQSLPARPIKSPLSLRVAFSPPQTMLLATLLLTLLPALTLAQTAGTTAALFVPRPLCGSLADIFAQDLVRNTHSSAGTDSSSTYNPAESASPSLLSAISAAGAPAAALGAGTAADTATGLVPGSSPLNSRGFWLTVE